MSISPRVALAGAVVVLAGANVLNNRLAESGYIATSVIASAALLLLLRACGATWADAGLRHDNLLRGLRWAFVLAVAVAAGYTLLVLLPATRDMFADPRIGSTEPAAIAFAICFYVPLGTVLLEEVGFRGVVYGLVRRARGTAWATAVSSGLFGLWHILPAAHLVRVHPALAGRGAFTATLVLVGALVAVSLAGAVLCELRRRSRSLATTAGLHWTTNALGYAMAWLIIHF
jgi:membrane protease YdiL (CAAX protease family)